MPRLVPSLVTLTCPPSPGAAAPLTWLPCSPLHLALCRRAADALTNLAHENVEIKNMVSAAPCSVDPKPLSPITLKPYSIKTWRVLPPAP